MIKKTVKLVKKNIAILLALLMIFTSFISIPAVPAMAAATNYYVDASNGNDANDGQSPSTAFKTIQKAADVAVSGDTVNILAGVYREDVTPKADNVTYTNYQGANVTISGCNLITGWTPDTDTNYSSLGVYVAPMNWDMYNGAGNIVFSDGQLMKEASWPDIPVSGLLTKTNYEKYTTVVPTPVTGPMTSFNDNNLKNAVFADNALAGAMLWTVSGNGYSSLTAAITGNTSTATTGTVTINWPFTATGYNPTTGNSVYYITRIKAVLNTATEWYKDVTNQKLYFITPDKSDPNGHVVEAKARDYAFELSGRSNITIKGINLRAAGVNFANSHYCTLQGADVQAVDNNEPVGINYNEGYTKGLTLEGDHNTIRDCEVHNMYGAGIVFSGHDNNAINNYVHDVDFNHNYADGIRIFGYNQLISNNTISNCARAGIGGTFTSSVIQYNDINNCMKLSSDGGAVYLVDSDYGGSEIHNNIVHDIASPGGLGGSGIYTDNSTHNLAIYNNIVYNCAGTSAALENGPNEYQLWENNTIKGNVTEYTNPGPLDYVDSTGTKVINEIAGGTEATNSTEVTSNNLANFPATGWKAPTATPPDFSLTATSPALGKGKVIPGVTDGYTGAAPNIGAVGNGPDWTKSVGCNLSNPSSVNAAFQLNSSIPYKNLVKNPGFEQGNGPKDLGLTGAGFAGPGSLAGWTVDSGSPYINTQNAWDYKITSLNRFNSNSAILPAGAKIEQTITGLKPNTSYTMTSWGRINGKLYQAENADAKSNASDFDTLNYRVETGLTNVNSVSAAPFPYLEFDNINFGVPGDLDNSISIGTYGKTTASTIEVHLDSPTGTLMSNFNGATYQSKTTQWMYTDFTLTGVPIDGANHKLYFVFKGAGKSGYLDGFKLYNSAPPTTEDITFGVTGYGGHDLTATVTGTNGVGYVNSSGQLQQKTIKFVTGPNSTSATIYASKAGGSLLGYVDAFGLAEDILQDPFGPGSTLTQYKDGFEDPTFSSWSWGYGAPALSSTVFNEGIHSYQVGGQDQGAIYKVFGSTYNKVATIDFYDNFSYNNNISAHVDQSGSTNFGNQSSMYGMGVITANSIQNYSYNLGSTTWKTSSVKRTKGWHTLTFDYSSGKGLNMYIDNILVASTSSITGFNTIAMGDFFADGIQGKGYFDNVRITNGLLISPSGATLPQITAPNSLTVGTETISDTTAAVNLSVSAASSIPNAANPVALSMTVDGTTPFSSGSKLSTGFHTITVKADDTSNGGGIAIKNIWINVVQTAVFDNFESYTGSILSGSTWVDGSNTAGRQTPSVATSGSYDGNRAFKYQASSTANATNANIDAMKLASGIPTGGLMGKTVSVWFYDPYNTSAKRVDQVLAIYGANNTFFLGTAYDAASGTTNGSSDYYCFRSTALGTTYGTKFLPINNTTAGLPVTVGLIPRSTGWHQFKIDFSTTATDGNVNLYVDNQLLYTSPNNQNDSLFLNGGSSGQIALGSFWTNGMDTTPTYYWDNFKITGLADTAGPSITASGNTSTYLNGSNGVTIDSGINFSDVDTAAIPATAEVQLGITKGFMPTEDILSFTGYANTGDIAGTYDSTTGLMTLTSAAGATKAQWQAALQSVQYRNTSATPTGLSRTISVIGFDGINMGQATAINVLLQGSNNPPVLANTNVNVNTGVTNAISDSSFGFTDPDGNIMTDVRIDSLPTNGVLKLNGTAVNAGDVIPSNKLMNLTYTPNSDYYGPDSFTWNGSDGTVYAANNATISIKVNNNDATLSGITVGGTAINGFAPTTTDYTALLPAGTTSVPVVTATTTDSNATEVITNAATLSGTTTIVVTAEDGTTTNTYTINFTVDKLNAVTIAADKTELGMTNKGKISISGKLDSGIDADLTKADIQYVSSNPEVASVDNNGVITPNKEGNAVITAIVNLYGTTIQSNNIPIVVDYTAPVTSAKVIGNGSNDWYNSTVTVTLTSSDNLSGVDRTEYRIGESGDWIPYNKPFDINKEGVYTLEYRSIDRAGNIEETKQQFIKIDKTMPYFNLMVNGNNLNDGASFDDYLPLSFKVSDDLSGIASAKINIGGEVYIIDTKTQQSVDIDMAGKLGSFTALVTLEDVAGNKLETTLSFNVTTSIDSMMQLVNRYINSGDLYGPIIPQLTNDLNQVQHQLDIGRLDHAAKHLQDFADHLNNKALSNCSSEKAKTVLNADAQKILNN